MSADNSLLAGNLAGSIQKYLVKKLLKEKEFKTPLSNLDLAEEATIAKGNGQYAEYRLFADFGMPDYVAEGVDPVTGQTVSSSVVRVPLKEIADWVDMTNLLLSTDWVNFLDKCYEQFKKQLKRKMNRLVQDALLTTATETLYGISFTNTKCPTIYAGGVSNFAALTADAFITMDDFRRARMRLANYTVPMFDGELYAAVITPNIEEELKNDPKFEDLVKRHEDLAKKTLIPGHIMDYGGLRWIRQTEAFRETLGGTEGTRVEAGEVYSAHVFGPETYGYLGLAGMQAKTPKFHYQDVTKTQCNPTLGYRVAFRANTLQPTNGVNIKGTVKYSEANA